MGAYQPENMDLYADEGLGALAREIVTEHPVLSIGAGLSTLVMAVVAANALWFQAAPHPAPMFETRTPIAAREIQVPAKPKRIDLAEATIKVKAPAVSATERELMRAVQKALAERGYYKGEVDGVTGSRTRAAITAFERDNGQTETGKPTVNLLTNILVSTPVQTVQVPVPSQKSPVRPDAIETASVGAISPTVVVDIQRGLKRYNQIDDLTIDGKMGRRTRHAIESFELSLGWDVTGRPSEKIVRKLRELGALGAG